MVTPEENTADPAAGQAASAGSSGADRTSGAQAERDWLSEQISVLEARMRARAWEFAGPMPLPPDLTFQQLRVVNVLMATPGMTGHELGQALGVSAPTASGLVERLVEKDLLERRSDDSDRRVRRLFLTERARDIVNEMDSSTRRLFARLLGFLEVDDLHALVRVYRALLVAMDAGEEAGVGWSDRTE
ncbi:MAG: MarR family transcriptional regulator [Micropruina sp.]|nr:MarR family transcriptional regulator [Micropruina sp.]